MTFKDKVIEVVASIPCGKVTTYGTVALLAGIPRGSRMVGAILHFNAERFDLPWHRVVNRHGYISTNCAEHTRDIQKGLLEQEGIEVSPSFIVHLKKYGWFGEDEAIKNN